MRTSILHWCPPVTSHMFGNVSTSRLTVSAGHLWSDTEIDDNWTIKNKFDLATNIFNVLVKAVKLVTQGLCHVICSLSKKLNWSSDQLNIKKRKILKLKIGCWIYCQTQKTLKTWEISGILIVYWPITIKFRIRKQTSQPQTNYRCCLRFSYLGPYWLISNFSQHNNIPLNISGVHGFVTFTVTRCLPCFYCHWVPVPETNSLNWFTTRTAAHLAYLVWMEKTHKKIHVPHAS